MKAAAPLLAALALFHGPSGAAVAEGWLFDEGETIPVARMSAIEASVGTTWHSLGKTPLSEASPYIAEWKSAGIKWFRSYINWEDIERGRKRRYAYPSEAYRGGPPGDRLERFYSLLRAAGIRPYATLIGGNPLYDPAYRSDRDFRKFAREKPEEDYLSPGGYAAFCAAFARRYKGLVSHYELGNEPHNYGFHDYYSDADKDSGKVWGAHYADYFNRAARAIRKEQPGAKILSAGEDGGGLLSVRRYLPLISRNVDILAIHPYATETDPGLPPIPERGYAHTVKPYLELAKANGIREVWITELGWQAPHDSLPDPDPGKGSRTSRIGQAKYLARSLFFYPVRGGIKVVGQFSWRESNPEFSLRAPALAAYRNLHALIKGSDPNAGLTAFQGATFSARFAEPGDGRYASVLEAYLLVKSARSAFLVLWLAKTQEDGFGKRKVSLSLCLPRKPAVASVAGHDILDGSVTRPAFAVNGKVLTLADVWVSDYPNLVEIGLR